MKNIKWVLIILGLTVPYLLIFKHFFYLGQPLSWGDAPFFYPENLKELYNLPFLWNERYANLGIPQNLLLWLYIPTSLFGLLNHYLGLQSDLLIRIVFYFPATLLAVWGSWLFLGRFTSNSTAKFLGSILYAFNGYFLLLIDGGQVGVALAYGLFPLVLYTLDRYLEISSINRFLAALIGTFVLINTDLRIALILFIYLIIWKILQIIKNKQINLLLTYSKSLLILTISLLLLNLFWIIPFFESVNLSYLAVASAPSFISMVNSLFLFQPHFPINEFGKILPTPFYFGLLPLILFAGLMFYHKSKSSLNYLVFCLLFLIFVFLAKGNSAPLGIIYDWFIQKIPFAEAFRDSSKFYIPLILSGAVLLSLSYELISTVKITQKPFLKWLLPVLIYFYLLLLIYPALFGQLSGVLGKNDTSAEFTDIYQRLNTKEGFFRTLWFDERPQVAFSTDQKPALSANTLHQDRPFASMIEGKYDLFNFLNNPQLPKWLNLLGVKYVMFPDNERKKTWSEKDIIEKSNFFQLVDQLSFWKKVSWGSKIPIYELDSVTPKVFAQNNIFAVVGGEEIYQNLLSKDFNLSANGFIFLEDGEINPIILKDLDPKSLVLVFYNREVTDLAMTYLQQYMLSPKSCTVCQWGLRESRDYLDWKYQLLLGDIRNYDFDFGQGIAFSSVEGESIIYDINVPYSGSYYLSLRHIESSNSAGIKITTNNFSEVVKNDQGSNFKWSFLGPLSLEKGGASIELENQGGFVSINTLMLVEQNIYDEAINQARQLSEKFPTVTINQDVDIDKIINLANINYIPLQYYQIDPTRYQIINPPTDVWIVLSEHYNSNWTIDNGNTPSLPFYSMVNGFWVGDDYSDKLDIYYGPQYKMIYWIRLSIVSGVVILIICLVLILRRRYLK